MLVLLFSHPALVLCPLSFLSIHLDLEVKIEVLIDVEIIWIKIVLNHVGIESENGWLNARVEMHRHRRHRVQGLLLVRSDLGNGGRITCAQIAEVELGNDRLCHARHRKRFGGGSWPNGLGTDGWTFD